MRNCRCHVAGETDATTAAARPRWLRGMAWLTAAYGVVMLGVFVKWQAALAGCLIAVCVDVAHD